LSEKINLTEEFRVTGDALLTKVKELIHAGNIRHITIRNEEGRILIELPLNIGVVGILLAPTVAAIGALAALVTSCKIEVRKTEDDRG
jgi:hypothetical protein